MSLAAILALCLVLSFPPGNTWLDSWSQMISQDVPPPAPEPAQPPQDEKPRDAKPDVKPEAPSQQAAEPSLPPQSGSTSPDSTQQPAPSPAPPASTTPPMTKTKTKSSKTVHKSKTATAPDGTPSKTVVRNGSTADPSVQLSPGLSEKQASRQLQSTDDLLSSTDESLKKISGQQLKPGQKEMADQIRRYMGQSRAAVAAGDLNRAHNLAFKARLLADELVRSGK